MEENKEFNLPKINLTDEKFNHKTKYRNIYINLINRCINMTESELSGYNEKHHILPKCMGGLDIKENLVLMPVRYHIVAHMLLAEIYPEIDGIIYSLKLMFNLENKDSDKNGIRERVLSVETHVSSRMVAYYKQISKHLSKDHIEKLKESNRKRVKDPEGKIYNSFIEASEETGMSIPTIENRLKDPTSGWKRLDKKKFSKSGSDSPNAKKIIGPDGTIYGSMIEALKFFDKGISALQNRLKGRVKSNEGWRYLNLENLNDTIHYSNKVNRELSIKINSKKIKAPDGKIFDSMKDALKEYNISRHTLINYLNSGKNGWKRI